MYEKAKLCAKDDMRDFLKISKNLTSGKFSNKEGYLVRFIGQLKRWYLRLDQLFSFNDRGIRGLAHDLYERQLRPFYRDSFLGLIERDSFTARALDPAKKADDCASERGNENEAEHQANNGPIQNDGTSPLMANYSWPSEMHDKPTQPRYRAFPSN